MKAALRIVRCLSAMGAFILLAERCEAGVVLADDGTGTLRNNFTGTVGYRFLVGPSNVQVTGLGF